MCDRPGEVKQGPGRRRRASVIDFEVVSGSESSEEKSAS